MGLITRREVSEVLGRPLRTISDWEKNGILKPHKINRVVYFDSDTINALKDTEIEIDNVVRERKAALEYMETELKSFRKEEHLNSPFIRNVFNLLFSHILNSEFSEREVFVFREVSSGKSLEAVGEKIGLSHERVRQIFSKAIYKIQNYARSYNEIYKELAETKEKAEREEMLVKQLKARIKSLEELCGEKEKRCDFTEEDMKLYKMEIADTPLPNRAKNCLRCAGIRNVYDLLQYNKSDIYKIRNMGRRTFSLIEEFVEKKLGRSFEDFNK